MSTNIKHLSFQDISYVEDPSPSIRGKESPHSKESGKDAYGRCYHRRASSLPVTFNDYINHLVNKWGLDSSQKESIRQYYKESIQEGEDPSFFEWCKTNFLP